MAEVANGSSKTFSRPMSGAWPTAAPPTSGRFPTKRTVQLGHFDLTAFRSAETRHLHAEKGAPREARVENIAATGTHAHDKGMEPVSREEIKTQIELSEAKADTKFAQLMGHIDTQFEGLRGDLRTFSARLESVEKSTAGLRTTVITTAIAAVVLVIAVMGYGAQWLGLGLNAQDISDKAARTAVHEILRSRALDAPPIRPEQPN